MIENRLLDCDNLQDRDALQGILDFYIENQYQIKNGPWLPHHSEIIARNVMDCFVPEFKDSVLISGTFIDGLLDTICVGKKMYPYFTHITKSSMPLWIMYLMCSRNIGLHNPASKIFSAGTHLVRRMEADGYTTFYQTFKFPNVKTDNDARTYIDNIFSKMSVMDRYVNLVEYIHKEGDTTDNIPFSFYKGLLGTNFSGNRKICITVHHLKNEYRTFNLS